MLVRFFEGLHELLVGFLFFTIIFIREEWFKLLVIAVSIGIGYLWATSGATS